MLCGQGNRKLTNKEAREKGHEIRNWDKNEIMNGRGGAGFHILISNSYQITGHRQIPYKRRIMEKEKRNSTFASAAVYESLSKLQTLSRSSSNNTAENSKGLSVNNYFDSGKRKLWANNCFASISQGHSSIELNAAQTFWGGSGGVNATGERLRQGSCCIAICPAPSHYWQK